MKSHIHTLISSRFKLLICIPMVIALILAFIPLRSQVTYGFDQARDAFEAYAIWHDKDIKLLGPSSDLPGVNHGVLWYYLIAIPYAISNGEPQFVADLFFILSFLTISLVWYLTRILFKDPKLAFIAASLYSLSPIFQASTRWLSNPTIAIFVSPLLLIFLWKYLENKQKLYAFLIGLCMGILVQANVAYGLFLLLIPFYLIIFKVRLSFKHVILFGIGLLIATNTYFVTELKYPGRYLESMSKFVQSGNTISTSVVDKVQIFLERLNQFFVVTFFNINMGLFIIIFLGMVFLIWKLKRKEDGKKLLFLSLWLLNIVFFQFFNSGVSKSAYLYFPSFVVLVILISYLLFQLVKVSKFFYILLLIIYVLQIKTSYDWIQRNYSPLSVQHGINLSDEKLIVDYTYQESNYEPFTIITVTNPLYINTTWAYIYEFYGKKKYSYLPYLYGRSQKGFLGNLPEKNFETKYRYLIIEPTVGIPQLYISKITYVEDTVSDVIDEKKIGNFVVQKRIFHKNKPTIQIPDDLKNATILND